MVSSSFYLICNVDLQRVSLYIHIVGASIARPLVRYCTAVRTANGRPYIVNFGAFVGGGALDAPQGHFPQTHKRAVVGASPYNNFTNYAVSICKLTEIIPQYLLFKIAVL